MDNTAVNPAPRDGAPSRSGLQVALADCVPAAERAGASRRAFLSGLWQAAIGTLIDAADAADAVDLLVERGGAIKGQGRNADAPLVILEGESLERRMREAAVAAAAIVDHLSETVPSEVDDEDFPVRLLDAAFALLQDTWGPWHLRRTVRDQVRAMESGLSQPVLPSEPAVSNHPPRHSSTRGDPVLPLPADRPPAIAALAPKEPRRTDGRLVDVHLDAETLAPGIGLFAYAMTVAADGRRETREVSGTVRDRAGRLAPVAGLVDALAGLGEPGEGESVRVATPVEALVRGLSGENAVANDPALAALWNEVKFLCQGRTVSCTLRRMGISGDLAQRCDRMVQARMSEMERAEATA